MKVGVATFEEVVIARTWAVRLDQTETHDGQTNERDWSLTCGWT